MCEEIRKWHTTVSGEGECQPRHRGKKRKAGRKGDDDDPGHHRRGCGFGSSRIVENGNDGITGVRLEDLIDVAKGEKKCDAKTKGQGPIDHNGHHDDFRDRSSRILHLFGPSTVVRIPCFAF